MAGAACDAAGIRYLTVGIVSHNRYTVGIVWAQPSRFTDRASGCCAERTLASAGWKSVGSVPAAVLRQAPLHPLARHAVVKVK